MYPNDKPNTNVSDLITGPKNKTPCFVTQSAFFLTLHPPADDLYHRIAGREAHAYFTDDPACR